MNIQTLCAGMHLIKNLLQSIQAVERFYTVKRLSLFSQSSETEPFVWTQQTILSCAMTPWVYDFIGKLTGLGEINYCNRIIMLIKLWRKGLKFIFIFLSVKEIARIQKRNGLFLYVIFKYTHSH